MKFISFTSGSCGNCYWLGSEDSALLIDAGASMRRARRYLMDNGLSINSVRNVLVTHDHLDHIRFLGTYCKYLMPGVCTTQKIHGVLAVHSFTRDHIAPCRRVLRPDDWNDLDGFLVRFFVLPHDSTQNVGYAVLKEDHLFVLMTDLEHVTPEAMQWASKADTVVIESNYDYDMLVNGPYPPELKQRILKEGHLSNSACACAIREFYHPSLKNLFLCHLSGNNNTPQLAYDSAREALISIGVPPGTVHLRTLERGVPSPVISL